MDAPADVPIGVGRGLLSLARQAGVGEKDIDRAVFVLSRRDQCLDIGFLADVTGDGEPVDVARDLCQPLARVLEVGNDDAARARLGIGPRRRRSPLP